MKARLVVLVVVLISVVAACAPADSDPDSEVSLPEAAAQEVMPGAHDLFLEVDGYTYGLDATDDDCVSLTVVSPAGEARINDACASVHGAMFDSQLCERRGGGAPAQCELWSPLVVYGRLVDGVGHVCTAEWSTAGFGSVQYLPSSPDGLILTEIIFANEGSTRVGPGHQFSPGGAAVGQPPLDAPSSHIYDMCYDVAPWATDDVGPSDTFRYKADVRLESASPDLAGRTIRLELAPNVWREWIDGRQASDSIQYVPWPMDPVVYVDGEPIPLSVDRPSSFTKTWRLFLVVAEDALLPDTYAALNPEAFSLEWR